MVDSLIAPGLRANILERTGTVLSASQTPSSLYPITRVADGRPSQMFIFPVIAANDYIQADINQVVNGDMENWTATDPDDFVVTETGTGLVSEETTGAKVIGGTGSGLKLTNGASGNAVAHQDVEALSGESIRFRANGLTDDAAEPATIEIQNLETGLYLTSGGAWQVAQTDCLTTASLSLVQVSVTFTVEAFSVTRSHFVTLRVRAHMDGVAANKQHNWDGLRVVPGVNIASIHGHNLDPKITPELHSDDASDFSGLTDHGDFTVDDPTFYMALVATVYNRHWRFQFTGTQSTPTGSAAIGLAFLGSTTALLRTPRHSGLSVAEELSQEEAATRLSGEQWRTQYAQFRRRFASLRFRHTQTMQVQFRDEILKRTNDGVDPMLLVIRDDRTNLCLHGRRPAGRADFVVEGGEVDVTELILHESGWGVITD